MLVIHDTYWDNLSLWYYLPNGQLVYEYLPDCFDENMNVTPVPSPLSIERVKQIFANSIIHDSIYEDTTVQYV